MAPSRKNTDTSEQTNEDQTSDQAPQEGDASTQDAKAADASEQTQPVPDQSNYEAPSVDSPNALDQVEVDTQFVQFSDGDVENMSPIQRAVYEKTLANAKVGPQDHTPVAVPQGVDAYADAKPVDVSAPQVGSDLDVALVHAVGQATAGEPATQRMVEEMKADKANDAPADSESDGES